MYRRILSIGLAFVFCCSSAEAQKAEVTVSLNEPFFDALLDSIYTNLAPPEFSIADNGFYGNDGTRASKSGRGSQGYVKSFVSQSAPKRSLAERPYCPDSIKVLREMNGTRTAVRFREGKIYVPLAFSGSYAAPIVGCVDFAGWAETNIDLEFDRDGHRLIGRARVLNVNLNGTGGVGGTIVAKLVQGAIDKKLNPIEIMNLDKLNFGLPIPNSGALQMKATEIRPVMANGALNVVITFQFAKA